MGTAIYLLIGSLATTQLAPADMEWPLAVRLERGQELVYRGHYFEESGQANVQFSRTYRLESRFFVLDGGSDEMRVAFFTLWRCKTGAADKETDLNSVRLEVAKVNARGQLRPEAKRSLAAPLDGPPTIECAALVGLPKNRVGLQQTWTEPEDGRPARTWKIVAIEGVGSIRCLKLIGMQQSPEWEQPRADRSAWKRTDTVWLDPRSGFSHKVERIIERRDPARREPSSKSVLRYELESNLQYPGQLFEDRRREILQAQTLHDTVSEYLPRAGQVGPRPFEVVLARVKNFQDQYPPTPYREAVLQAKRLAEAGKRGESPPSLPAAEPVQLVAHVIAAGKPAPDFLAKDFVTQDSTRLKHWLGQPVLLVFFNPRSASAEEVLRFAQRVDDKLRQQVHVLTLALSDDAKTILEQREKLKLYVPVLSGTGLRLSYAVEATPKLVVLDAAGVVQTSYIGWGPETPASVLADVQRCLEER